MTHHLITFMVFLPFIGALLQAFLPLQRSSGGGLNRPNQIASWIALGTSLAASLCGVALVASMKTESAEVQHSEFFSWIGSYAISYDMGVDGLSVLMVLLVAIIFPLLIAAEWNRKDGLRGMHGLILILQSAFFGAVCAQDIFLMFFFWALSALPFYFLIGIWGGPGRENAAFRSIIVAAIGNALFFGALVLIYYSLDPHTFSLRELSGGKLEGKTFEFLGRELSISSVAFGLMGAGLAFRAPIWPLHGWFTRVAEEAPPSAFVAISAVSVPVAMYIFIRLSYALFPATVGALSHWLVMIGVLNLIVGGVCAAAQRDLRLLLAFICLSEIGLVLIGAGSLSAIAVVGSIFQILALGLGLAGFGLVSGIIIGRTGRSEFLSATGQSSFGGISTQAPGMAVVAGVVVASLLGMPGFGGFVGHALLLLGTFAVHPGAVVVAGAIFLLAAYYLFMMYRYVFLGKPRDEGLAFPDLTIRERAYLLPLVAGLLVIGLYPKPLIELVRPTVLTLLSTIKQ